MFKQTTLLLAIVTLCAPGALNAETRVVRFAGQCDLKDRQRPEDALQATAESQLRYTARITCMPFLRSGWIINPLLSVANPTQDELYCHYYIAFFDADDRLVGCCHQGTDVEPGVEARQLGSCIIRGPKSRLLAAVRYNAVIYESDRPIGTQPISAADVPASVDGPGKAAVQLSNAATAVIEGAGFTEFVASAACRFAAPEEDTRPAQLRLGRNEEYLATLNSRRFKSIVTRTAGGQTSRTELVRWETNVEVERRPRDRSATHVYHAALLDAEGNLVVCSTYTGGRWLYAPADKALSATRLLLTVYETPKDPAGQDEDGAEKAEAKPTAGEPANAAGQLQVLSGVLRKPVKSSFPFVLMLDGSPDTPFALEGVPLRQFDAGDRVVVRGVIKSRLRQPPRAEARNDAQPQQWLVYMDVQTAAASDKPFDIGTAAAAAVGDERVIVWDPAVVEGGFMFASFEAFRDYVRGAEVVFIGTLVEWDGTAGTAHAAKLLHGELKDADTGVRLESTGGIIRAKSGQTVVVLLSRSAETGKLQLHSFCGASGMFRLTEELQDAVRRVLDVRGEKHQADLSGTWHMTLRVGVEFDVEIKRRQDGLYQLLKARNLSCTFRRGPDGRLIEERGGSNRYVWQPQQDGSFRLVAPPVRNGGNYIGAVLRRKLGAGDEPEAKPPVDEQRIREQIDDSFGGPAPQAERDKVAEPQPLISILTTQPRLQWLKWSDVNPSELDVQLQFEAPQVVSGHLVLPVAIRNRSERLIGTRLANEWHGGEWPPTDLYASVTAEGAEDEARFAPVYQLGERNVATPLEAIRPGEHKDVTLRMDWAGTGSVRGVPLLSRDKPGRYRVQLLLILDHDGRKEYVVSSPQTLTVEE